MERSQAFKVERFTHIPELSPHPDKKHFWCLMSGREG